jgi:signal transduction histidine kinase
VAQPQVRVGELGPALFVALVADGSPFGILSVARVSGSPVFSAADLEMVRSFAAQASVALERDRYRQRLQRLALLEDQERIARDLHDSVIQRLFAVGLSLQAMSGLIQDPHAHQRLVAAVDELDLTVRHIRTVIFDVEAPRSGLDQGVRAWVRELSREAGRSMGFEPRVTFAGALDATVPSPLGDDLVATLREALSNITRHARASHVDVEVSVSATSLVLRVSDDGIGFEVDSAAWAGGHGLHNMSRRAERLGGSFNIAAGPNGGTVLDWDAPLPARSAPL